MYETFRHTLFELGLRVRAADLNTLFSEAGRGLFSIIVENLDDVAPKQFRSVTVEGNNVKDLLCDWLNELRHHFETEYVLYSKFDVEVMPDGVAACAIGEMIDSQRHRLQHQVKPITNHGLKSKRRRMDGLRK